MLLAWRAEPLPWQLYLTNALFMFHSTLNLKSHEKAQATCVSVSWHADHTGCIFLFIFLTELLNRLRPHALTYPQLGTAQCKCSPLPAGHWAALLEKRIKLLLQWHPQWQLLREDRALIIHSLLPDFAQPARGSELATACSQLAPESIQINAISLTLTWIVAVWCRYKKKAQRCPGMPTLVYECVRKRERVSKCVHPFILVMEMLGSL